MKNSFNYSGFCKSRYSFNSKKSERGTVADESGMREDPAWRVPPYLAQPHPPVTRFFKGGE